MDRLPAWPSQVAAQATPARPSPTYGYYAPAGPDFRVNNNTNYSQYWVRVASNEDAEGRSLNRRIDIAFAYED